MEILEIAIHTPNQPTEAVKKQVDEIGLELFNLLQDYEHIKKEIQLDGSKKPHVAWQLIKAFLATLATKTPNSIHYTIVGETLKSLNSEHKDDNHAISILVGIFHDYCKKLNATLQPPKEFSLLLNETKKIADQACDNIINTSLDIIEIPYNDKDGLNLEEIFEKKGMFVCDYTLLKIISSTGVAGKKTSNELIKKRKKKWEDSKSIGESPINFWLNKDHIYQSPALKILVEVILKDKVLKKINLREKHVPAITKGDNQSIMHILSPYNIITQTDQQIKVYDQEKSLLATISIPTVHQDVLKIVAMGVNQLNTLIAHRFIRYIPRMCFSQMTDGIGDYRVIRRERGWSEIAEHLQLTNRQHISRLKQVGYAMAYCEWDASLFSGNLLSIKRDKSDITKRWEALEITAGTMLLPYRACELFKNGDSNLLIPILEDPPLVGANQYHAGQFLFQMQIISEFSRQSIELYKHGFIELPPDKWEKSAQACGIEPILKKVQDRWTQDGDDGPKLLEKIDQNFYTLGKAHEKVLKFLIEQGSIRSKNSERGKKSADKRKN